MELKTGRVAVVTGAARRIGEVIAVQLHRRGFDIALHYRSSQGSARALADKLCEIRAGSCTTFQADLGNVAQVSDLAREIITKYGSIDLLVNNASSYSPTPIETCTQRQFDEMLNDNLRGPYFLIQGLLPGLQSCGKASVVNLLDVHVETPLRDYNAYCAAKAGLASLTRSLALELAPSIRVNGVAPGAILWPEDEESYDTAMRDETIKRTPLQRLGKPEDVAAAVTYLACDAAFTTGHVTVVDGGRGLTR
ncbi:MAG: pteridine reductase [Halioglobus sp.]|nr:pteridine reductase [Halioglobus sp.]